MLEEVLVVEKRLRFVEEVHVTQRGDREEVSVPMTLRRQVAEIERTPVAESPAPDDADPAGLARRDAPQETPNR